MSTDAADAAVDAAITVRALVADNVSRLRRDAEATHGDIATAAFEHGLEWTEAWIVGVERGQKALSAEHLLALPIVLATALRHRVSLADLLIGDDEVALAVGAEPVTAAHLRDIVTASALRRSFGTISSATPETPEMIEAAKAARRAERLLDIRRAGLGDVDIRRLAETETGAGDAEERLARKHGVSQAVIVAASAIRWGRSYTQERAAQLAELTDLPSVAKAKRTAAINRELGQQLADQLAAGARAATEAATAQ